MKKPFITAILVILVALLAVVAVGIVKVELGEEGLKVGGLFRTELRYSDIDAVERLPRLPLAGVRKLGIGMGFLNVGKYWYKDYGDVTLIQVRLGAPYVLVRAKAGTLILGLGSERNEEIYRALAERGLAKP